MNGLRISELATRAGVATSTVRYYERVGLLPAPERDASGYRAYDHDAEARLLFITRAKRLGLSLDEIAELATIWDGSNCGATQERLSSLLVTKRAELVDRVRELEAFDRQLADVQTRLASTPAEDGCAPDLSCCAPDLTPTPVALGVRPAVIACTLPSGE